MTELTTFIHLTDLHIANPAKVEPHLYTDTAKTLSDVLARVRAIEPRPSFIVVSGDIANNADPAAYAELQRVWGVEDIPAFFALGNHDSRTGFHEVMLGQPERGMAPYSHDAVIAGIHLIVLDSSTPGAVHGTIEPEQFDWLQERLEAHPELPKLLVSHHPPALGGEPDGLSFETIELADSLRLGEMIRGRNVIGILCGHIHQDRVSVWNGVPVIIGNGHHSRLDVLRHDVLRSTKGEGFALCTLRPNGLTVNFIGLPTDGQELSVTTMADLDAYMAKLKAAAEPATV